MIDRSGVTRWNVFKFLVTKVPSVLWFGVKLKSIKDDTCTVVMRRNWRNRNPHNSAYFAAVMAAGEMATGLLLFDEIIKQAKDGTVLVASITGATARFLRPVVSPVDFVCRDGAHIRTATKRAHFTRHSDVTALTRATNSAGKQVAQIEITWRITRTRITACPPSTNTKIAPSAAATATYRATYATVAA